MANKGKAYRIWKSKNKYISRIKECLHYWMVRDPSAPRGWRRAKNWKELDSNPSSGAKRYKNTPQKWTYRCNQYDAHKIVKGIRRETKNLTNNTLKQLDNDTV